ncbi:MAG: zf-TFIIB domain-containing protein [Chloroflexota bacterium]|nr:zf-TFIIB domain-containing protein [Chloroflexota bacterium]
MKCPACSNLMIVVEHEKIELDYCVNCSGVWFDAGELELLLETMQLEGSILSLDSVLTSPEADSAEKRRRCPICGVKMKKATVGHEPEVLIDACQRGDGLWFDEGEVGQLITQLTGKPSDESDSQGRVITFLGDVFRARD